MFTWDHFRVNDKIKSQTPNPDEAGRFYLREFCFRELTLVIKAWLLQQ